jgi:peptidoglycan/xylan/chitin deacetylase (PgdA/CDA1 family)
MQYHKYTILLGLLLFSTSFCWAQQNKPSYTIAPWLNGKKAALSLTFDDAINGQFTVAVPMLNKYGFRSTFFIISNLVQPQLKSWQPVTDAADSGHEIANHTLAHPHLHSLGADSIAYQFTACNQNIAEHIPLQTSFTLAYPYGDGGNNTDSEQVVRNIASQYFTGARATRNNKLPYNTYHFANSTDDYYKVNSDMIADSVSQSLFPAHLDETITAGGWYVPTYHGIENGWIIVKKEAFAQQLTEVNKRKNDLWIAPFGEVIKYIRERDCITLSIAFENRRKIVFALRDTLGNNQVYNQPLTIQLIANGYKVKNIKQGNNTLPFTKDENMITFNALPGKENIIITKL